MIPNVTRVNLNDKKSQAGWHSMQVTEIVLAIVVHSGNWCNGHKVVKVWKKNTILTGRGRESSRIGFVPLQGITVRLFAGSVRQKFEHTMQTLSSMLAQKSIEGMLNHSHHQD